MSEIALEKKDEIQILEWAKSKNLKLPANATDEQIVLRAKTLFADRLLKDAVDKFFEYEDQEGKKGSSKGGLVTQVNKRIKQSFNKSVKEIFHPMELSALASIRETISVIIKKGLEQGRSRREIKDKCYEAINNLRSWCMGDVWN